MKKCKINRLNKHMNQIQYTIQWNNEIKNKVHQHDLSKKRIGLHRIPNIA